MKRRLILFIAAILPAVIAGCLTTGTVVFVYDIIGFESTSDIIVPVPINLSLEEDYRDNRDKIKAVEAVTPAGEIINRGSESVRTEIWISDAAYTSAEQVRANATRIFYFPSIAPGDTLVLDWADGTRYAENSGFLEDQVLGDGNFFIYGIASGDFHVEYRINFVVAVTVGL